MYIYIHTNISIHTNICMYVKICICKYTYIDIYIYIHGFDWTEYAKIQWITRVSPFELPQFRIYMDIPHYQSQRFVAHIYIYTYSWDIMGLLPTHYALESPKKMRFSHHAECAWTSKTCDLSWRARLNHESTLVTRFGYVDLITKTGDTKYHRVLDHVTVNIEPTKMFLWNCCWYTKIPYYILYVYCGYITL